MNVFAWPCLDWDSDIWAMYCTIHQSCVSVSNSDDIRILQLLDLANSFVIKEGFELRQ